MRFLSVIIILSCSFLSLAQKRAFSFQHYGPEEGLNNTNVFSIKQDANHILYMATENGVYSYDGYNFIKIKPKTSLKSNFIRNIEFDSLGRLLIINRREGIYEYDRLKNDVTLLNHLNFKNSVDELFYDQNYTYSLNYPMSIGVLGKDGQLIQDQIWSNNKRNQALALFKASDGKVFSGRSDGLYLILNGIQKKIDLGGNYPVYSITEDEKGMLYLGSSNAIYVLDKLKMIKTIPVKTKIGNSLFGFNESNVSKIAVDKYGKIWFVTQPDDNLYFIDQGILFDVFDLLGIDKVLINCIYKDNEDHIWIGTFNDGIYFIQNPHLQNISFVSGRKTLPVNCGIFIDKQIAVGTNNGFFLYDYKSGNMQTVIPSDELFNEKIYSIHAQESEIIYAKDPSSENEHRPYLIGENYYQFIPVASRVFVPSYQNTAIIADWSGILYRGSGFSSKKYKIEDTLVSYPDYKTRINTVFENDQAIFIGTSDGLSIYKKSNKTYSNYRNPIFNYGINDISSHLQKTYLAHENGITIFEDSLFIQQIGDHRLSSVKKIKFYQNNIWLATLDGLYICDEKFNPIVIYNKSNGLLSNTINDVFFDGNQCCICSDKGITVCDINDLLKQIRIPEKVFVNSLYVNDDSVMVNSSLLHLKKNETDVTINFSSPLFSKPNKQFFRYQFDDGKWMTLENTQVHLTSIIGGKHQVQIVCSYDGVHWSEPLVIEINKDIPFNETIWYVISIVLSIVVLIILIAWFWARQIRKNANRRIIEEREVNLLKHQAMNSLMSPHFIFNSLTSIQNYINANDSLKASEFLAKFSRLIRMIIEKASQSDISLHEELTRLSYYLELEKERFKGKFDFFIELDPNIDPSKVKIPNMIIQPYAENSIIHGILPKHEHGNLHIRFVRIDDQNIIIEIEDDGIGYNKAKENVKVGHKSLGTKTIENILELNTKLSGKKQKVTIVDKSDTGKGQGTIITISLQV